MQTVNKIRCKPTTKAMEGEELGQAAVEDKNLAEWGPGWKQTIGKIRWEPTVGTLEGEGQDRLNLSKEG